MTRTGKFVINQIGISSTNGDKRKTTSAVDENLHKITLAQRLEYSLSLLNRLLIGFVTIYMCWMCLRQWHIQEIPWHALLCTLGFICLMSEGLMAHYRGNVWTQLCYRAEKTRTHWLLQLIGSIIGLIGISIKISLEDLHFHTIHGKLGLATFILCFLSLMSGLSALYAFELNNRIQPLLNKAIHCIIGLCVYTVSAACMFYSFETDIFIEYSMDATYFLDFRLLLQIMTALIWLLSIYGPAWCLIYSKLWKFC